MEFHKKESKTIKISQKNVMPKKNATKHEMSKNMKWNKKNIT